jgi:hypothetical protein
MFLCRRITGLPLANSILIIFTPTLYIPIKALIFILSVLFFHFRVIHHISIAATSSRVCLRRPERFFARLQSGFRSSVIWLDS